MTKIENILTHYFVTKVDSNYEKKNRKKISHDCPFKESYNIPWSSGFPLTFGKLAWRKRERELNELKKRTEKLELELKRREEEERETLL